MMHKNRANRRAEGMGHCKAAADLHSSEAHDLLTPHDSGTSNFGFYTDNSL